MSVSGQTETDDDELLLRRLIRCEEDRRRLAPTTPWSGSLRWFSSPNVVDLQHYRSPAEKERIRVVVLGRTLRFAHNFLSG
jgi:hypothetical protein